MRSAARRDFGGGGSHFEALEEIPLGARTAYNARVDRLDAIRLLQALVAAGAKPRAPMASAWVDEIAVRDLSFHGTQLASALAYAEGQRWLVDSRAEDTGFTSLVRGRSSGRPTASPSGCAKTLCQHNRRPSKNLNSFSGRLGATSRRFLLKSSHMLPSDNIDRIRARPRSRHSTSGLTTRQHGFPQPLCAS